MTLSTQDAALFIHRRLDHVTHRALTDALDNPVLADLLHADLETGWQVCGILRAMRRIWLLGLLVLVLACDQATKIAARANLRGASPREHGVLTLVYAENPGAFLSLGASLPPVARRVIFDGLVTVGLAVAAWFLFTGRVHGGGDDVALALIVAGGVGNLIDRMRFGGHVTDFLYMHAGPLHTGVFNVADMAITGGVLWLALGWMFRRRKQ